MTALKIISKFLKKRHKRGAHSRSSESSHIIPRDHHSLSRKQISPNALKVLYRLHQAGFEAHLVGGSVRDSLLGREPKDFDVATDAEPEEIRKLFKNCRLIGRRFRLAHIHFHREIIEVATFRADDSGQRKACAETGMVLRDNVYGTLEEDAWRRDFTINALYYNIADFSVIDYTQGLADLDAGLIRIIGDPKERYREDPVRMLRAIRFAAKLGFRIEKATEDAIVASHDLLDNVATARLFDEMVKLFLTGHGAATYALLHHYDLLVRFFPLTEQYLREGAKSQACEMMILQCLKDTDQRLSQDKPVTPAFLFAAMLWHPTQERVSHYLNQGESEHHALQQAWHDISREQLQYLAIPRRFLDMIEEIYSLQFPLIKRKKRSPMHLLTLRRFRAAYDFLLLRTMAEPNLKEAANWWTDFQHANKEKRQQMMEKLPAGKPRKRRRRKPQE
ncbi:MAG: poly(A) polymerase [Legionellales bacterium]|nr:poly(A) polymerase [Legionellales bacterium]|tara:strand:- start:27139 stop:28482 length:1344 start_codon:yes stop_codon:yes gene_type:complete